MCLLVLSKPPYKSTHEHSYHAIYNNVCLYIINLTYYVTNRGRGLYQIYKPEAKSSVYTSDINRTQRFVYCFESESFPTLSDIQILDNDVF